MPWNDLPDQNGQPAPVQNQQIQNNGGAIFQVEDQVNEQDQDVDDDDFVVREVNNNGEGN